jgi:hypothetical protein
MTTMTPVCNPLIDLKPWLIAQPDLAPLHGGRVFFKFPVGLDAYPAVRMYNSVLPVFLPNDGGMPVVDAHIAFDVFGGSDEDFDAVNAIATTLVGVLNAIQPGTVIGGTRVLDADAIGGTDSPDPATGWPRYILDTRWTCTAT